MIQIGFVSRIVQRILIRFISRISIRILILYRVCFSDSTKNFDLFYFSDINKNSNSLKGLFLR